jgi:hypothetical protein
MSTAGWAGFIVALAGAIAAIGAIVSKKWHRGIATFCIFLIALGSLIAILSGRSSNNQPTPSPDNGPTSPSGAIRWQGSITINQQGVELDAIPPSYSGSSTLFFLLGAGKTVEAGGGAFMANWTGSSAPTRSQCQNQLLTSNVGVVDVFVGQGICVETQEKHIAYLSVTGVSSNSVEAQATVWN